MDWVSHAVSAFGQSVGIPDLSLDDDGGVLFTLEPDGVLCVRDLLPLGGNDVLVTLVKPLPSPSAAAARRGLLAADFRVNPTSQIQLGVRGANLVATLRMPRHSFMQSALEDALDTLFDFHARVAQMH